MNKKPPTVAQREAGLRYKCPRCGGRWKERRDAEECHGVLFCTQRLDCPALSHRSNCKSMPSTPLYTLNSIQELAREWAGAKEPLGRLDENLSVGTQVSDFLAWMAERESRCQA